MKLSGAILLLCTFAGSVAAAQGPAPDVRSEPEPKRAQQKNESLGIAYCDVDHLYDTIPSLFYNDTDYTPQGRRHWNTQRYRCKIARTTALVDSLGVPVIGLWGVENEEVVRDISRACEGDYTYLHRTLNSLDGMDFALLYHADKFFPHYVEPGRRYLYVEGILRRPVGRGPQRRFRSDTLGLVLCSEARIFRWVVEELRDERPGAKLVTMGRLPAREAAKYGLQDVHAQAEKAGHGNIRSRAGWVMRDRIAVDTALHVGAAGVYIRRFLLDPAGTRPLPAFDRHRYAGGTSYALPVYVYLE